MQWHAYGDRQYTSSRYLLVRSASPSDSWALVFVEAMLNDMGDLVHEFQLRNQCKSSIVSYRIVISQ